MALEAEKRGIRGMVYEARLALGKAEMKYGKQAEGRARLAGVEKDAASSGFVLRVPQGGNASSVGGQTSGVGRRTSGVVGIPEGDPRPGAGPWTVPCKHAVEERRFSAASRRRRRRASAPVAPLGLKADVLVR